MNLYRIELCECCGEIMNHYAVSDHARCHYQGTKPLSNTEIKTAITKGLLTGSFEDSCTECFPPELAKIYETISHHDLPHPKHKE